MEKRGGFIGAYIYIYMEIKAPVDLTNANILVNRPNAEISVDTDLYMTSGGGRFVNAKSFDFIKNFFTDNTLYISIGVDEEITNVSLLVELNRLYPGRDPNQGYKKLEVLTAMEYYNLDLFNLYGRNTAAELTQALYDDGKGDYAERTYIWNTTQFKVHDDTKFFIYPNGSREIKDFAIVPITKIKGPDEDFDFEGGFISDLGNPALEGVVDPSGIGKKVNIEFVNENSYFKNNKIDLRWETFQQIEKITSSLSNGYSLNSKIENLTNDLFNSGSTKFLDKDSRPILYGSNGSDALYGTISADRYDISDKYQYGGYYIANLKNNLSDYITNGIHYIGGAGDDVITSTQYNDMLHGGADNDRLYGGLGENQLYGDDGNDHLFGGDNKDKLYGGTGLDYLFGGKGNDILYGGSEEEPNDAESDHLYGGTGFDTFYTDHKDIIYLTDKQDNQGKIFLDQQELTEGTRSKDDPEGTYKDKHGNTYVFDGNDLIINSGLRIKNFKTYADTKELDGETIYAALGITLAGEEKDENPEAKNKIDPIIIDLNGDGVQTIGLGNTYFDHEGDGLKEQTGWVSPADGLLVWDLNGDGIINDGSELFGNNSLLSNGKRAKHGYEALAELDENGDGVIDHQDSAYSSLMV